MESGALVSEGLNLMLLGMGTVFVFLTILVFVTSIMSSLVQKYGAVQPADPVDFATAGQLDDDALLAVISAAIHRHCSKN